MINTTRKLRLGAISSILTQNPNVLYPLSYFSAMFGSSKSTLSEDMTILKESFETFGIGSLEVVMGAAGGVRYVPSVNKDVRREAMEEILEQLMSPSRILPGGYVYTADILLTPKYTDKMAQIIWGWFRDTNPDFIITVEAKGIALAASVARLFGKPLVVARRESKLTEGSVVTINYLSGSANRMQKMSISKRAIREGQKTLIIDDFIAGGGTIRAIYDIMKEFSVDIVGCAAAISTKEPIKKRVNDYKSIFILEEANSDENNISFRLSPDIDL